MIFAEYASPTPGRAFNSAAEAVLMSTRSPCEGAGEVALGVAALEGAVALGLAGASFPVGEVDWANTGKAIFRARIVAPRRDYVHRFSPFVLGQILRVEHRRSNPVRYTLYAVPTTHIRGPVMLAAHGPARRHPNAAGGALGACVSSSGLGINRNDL